MALDPKPDTQALAALHSRAFSKSGQRSWSAEEISSLIENQHITLFCEYSGDTLCGFAIISGILNEVELLTIAIDPAYWGRKHAQQLLRRIENIYKSTEGVQLIIEVAFNNSRALRLYSLFGYEVTSIRKHYYKLNNGKVDAIVMQKTIY